MRHIKEHGVWIWRVFLDIQLLFFYSFFVLGWTAKRLLYYVYQNLQRSLATIAPHDRLFFPLIPLAVERLKNGYHFAVSYGEWILAETASRQSDKDVFTSLDTTLNAECPSPLCRKI